MRRSRSLGLARTLGGGAFAASALAAGALAASALGASTLGAQEPVPGTAAAVHTDPPRDTVHPARMAVLHVPSGGVRINGVAYLAAGAGVHPTLVIFHGLPGNEKNLDLAQAVRRAGWHAVTVNYRGSWGSPGRFTFAHCLEDARAVLAHLRDPATVRALGIDTTRLAIAGHSMGGWVSAHTAARDRGVRGVALISAADMAPPAEAPRAAVTAVMADNMESLAGVTAAGMAGELMANRARWALSRAIPALVATPLLVLSSDDGNAPATDALAAAVRAAGNTRVTARHVATDHSWSDRRVTLASALIAWLETLAR